MLHDLDRKQRLRLMKFVCSFAWADLEIHEKERAFVRKIVERLGLDAAEQEMVAEWLEVPPKPQEVDPGLVPLGHRQLFLDMMKAVVVSDGYVDPEERVNLALFDALVR